MPALITHHLFGHRSIGLLAEGIITSEDERTAFLIANQGPDPFFYRFRSVRMRACMALGHAMHRERISKQLAHLREGVGLLLDEQTDLGRAFALGMLSHYMLDRTAHPFVYAQQYGIQRTDPELADASSSVHAVIESDLDLLMLQRERSGATVEDFPPVRALTTTDRIDKVGGALACFIAHRVYGIEIAANDYGGAVADMSLIYRLIEPAGSGGGRLVGAVEGLMTEFPLISALSHRVTDETPARTGNLDHLPWSDPFTEATSDESFPDVFDRALRGYAQMARRFMDGDDPCEITGHLNYSGRPLDADEEYGPDEERGQGD